jgi:hypothetical protein
MLLGNRRQKQEEARKCVAEFVNSNPDDLVFVQNATTGKSDSIQFKTLKQKYLKMFLIGFSFFT